MQGPRPNDELIAIAKMQGETLTHESIQVNFGANRAGLTAYAAASFADQMLNGSVGTMVVDEPKPPTPKAECKDPSVPIQQRRKELSRRLKRKTR